MKRVWLVTASLIAVTALSGAGITYALFTANAEPAKQQFTAGTLALEGNRDQGDTIPGPMFYIDGSDDGLSGEGDPGEYGTGLWAPGDAHHRVFEVSNIGSLDAKILKFSASKLVGNKELADQLDVFVYDGAYRNTDGTLVDDPPNLLVSGKLSEFLGEGKELPTPYLLMAGDVAWFGIEVSFPLDAGNKYQGDSIKVTFSAHAVQAKSN